MEKQKSNLYPVKDLLLEEKDYNFYAYSRDIIKSRVSRKLRKKKNGIIETEYCYCLPDNVIKSQPNYQKQLPNARYIKNLCILDDQKNVIQEVPILRVIQSRSGALNFGIDRQAFTENLMKQTIKDK